MSNAMLDEFVSEGRELLEQAGDALLQLERAFDEECVNRLFRAIHTLKGASGIFDIEPFTRAVHAAEDLLDSVRSRHQELTADGADAVLEVMDHTANWLDDLERTGALTEGADAIAERLSTMLRALVVSPTQDTDNAPAGPLDRPDWVGDVTDPGIAAAVAGDDDLWCVTYCPDERCFYSGDDPLLTVSRLSGLLWLDVVDRAARSSSDDFDPFHCNLEFRMVVRSDEAVLRDDLAYIDDQVRLYRLQAHDLSSPDGAPSEWSIAALEMLHEQLESVQLQSDPALLAGHLASTATILRQLAQSGHVGEAPMPIDAALEESCDSGSAAPLVALMDAWITGSSGSDGVEDVVEAGASVAPAVARNEAGALRHLRVDVERVDRLMDLTGELVVAKNALPYLAKRASTDFAAPRLAKELHDHHAVMSRICDELQQAVMSVRLMGVGHAFQRFPRLVRDLSRRQGKTVRLVLQGQDVQADKTIVEELAEPLVHLVRNALDHGIEPPAERLAAGKPEEATLRLAAIHSGDRVRIRVEDDGRGIDPARVRSKAVERGLISAYDVDKLNDDAAIQLVFLAGFSTAETVSDLSGRGVGMDAVRNMVVQAGGTLSIESHQGFGTAITLVLPLSTAVSRIMMVEADEQPFGIPMECLRETGRIDRSAIRRVGGREGLVLRDRLLPLYRLRTMIGLNEDPERTEEYIMVLSLEGEEVAVVVDRFYEGMDVIMKPLAGVVGNLSTYRGTTLLGDGRVLLILDIEELIRCQ